MRDTHRVGHGDVSARYPGLKAVARWASGDRTCAHGRGQPRADLCSSRTAVSRSHRVYPVAGEAGGLHSHDALRSPRSLTSRHCPLLPLKRRRRLRPLQSGRLTRWRRPWGGAGSPPLVGSGGRGVNTWVSVGRGPRGYGLAGVVSMSDSGLNGPTGHLSVTLSVDADAVPDDDGGAVYPFRKTAWGG